MLLLCQLLRDDCHQVWPQDTQRESPPPLPLIQTVAWRDFKPDSTSTMCSRTLTLPSSLLNTHPLPSGLARLLAILSQISAFEQPRDGSATS